MSEPVPEYVYGGCAWPIDPACLTEEYEAQDPLVQERARALASESLRRLTAYRVGGCPVTVRPCQRGGCWDVFTPGSAFTPINYAGRWSNCACGGNCATNCEVTLPGPVGVIEEVLVDGTAVPETDYEIQGDRLVFIGSGDCPFPTTQDLSLPITEPGTFAVTYLNAYPVDSLGANAAGILTVEFAKACTTGKCRLPKTVTDVVRNGVSFTIQPGMFPGGFTGIETVDAYISLWKNKNSPLEPTRVWSPDVGMRVVR
jgi:hypothetical protein